MEWVAPPVHLFVYLILMQKIIILLFFFSFNVTAQTYVQWPVGHNSWIDFRTEPPTIQTPPLSNKRNYPVKSPPAAACDSSGSCLFYTDLCNIWSNNNLLIETKSPMHLDNTQQAAVTLPSLSHPGNYRLFYTGQKTHINERVKLGVFSIEINPQTWIADTPISNILVYGTACNKLTAVRHANGKDYWLIARSGDTVFAIQYSDQGCSMPVKNILPIPYSVIGNLKASHDGKFFIECSQGKIYSYGFDSQTGTLSDQTLVDNFYSDTITSGHPYFNAHDIAFSPNDSLYYVIDEKQGYLDSLKIFQYRRHSANPRSIRQKLFFAEKYPRLYDTLPIKGHSSFALSGIQLAPNGKIYFLSYTSSPYENTFMGEIKYPDRVGTAAGLVPRSIDIGRQEDVYGLPFALYNGRFPNFFFNHGCDSFPTYKIQFQNQSHPDFKNLVWYFGDGDSAIVTSSQSTIAHIYKSPGSYLVRLKASTQNGYIAWYSDSVIVKPFAAKLEAKDSIAYQYVNTAFLATLVTDSTEREGTYFISFGDGKVGKGTLLTGQENSIFHVYNSPGVYDIWMTIKNRWGCLIIKKQKAITIITAPKPGFLLSTTTGCAPLKLDITDQSSGSVKNKWYTINDTGMLTGTTVTILQPGTYKIKQHLESDNGCITADSETVIVKQGMSPTEQVKTKYVTVQKNRIMLAWHPTANTRLYAIYRSRQSDTAHYYAGTAYDTLYVDSAINPSLASYTYYIVAVDSCGNSSDTSKPASTIYLSAQESENSDVSLNWNPSVIWPQGIKNYAIGYLGDTGAWHALAKLNSTGYVHTDFAGDLQRRACYRITGYRNGGTDSTVSNEACVKFAPRIWIPDAFTPNGDNLNDSFGIKGLGLTDIAVTIAARDHGRVFTSVPGTTFWDGRLWRNEKPLKPMPPGVYLYFIQTKGKDGWIYKSGLVTLLR